LVENNKSNKIERSTKKKKNNLKKNKKKKQTTPKKILHVRMKEVLFESLLMTSQPPSRFQFCGK